MEKFLAGACIVVISVLFIAISLSYAKERMS